MKSLNLLILRCRDMEMAKAFYECFGMTFTRHSHGSGPEHYAAEDELGVFELYPLPPGAAIDGTGLGFAADDLDALFEKIFALGFVAQPISLKAWGRTFIARDPDGRRVEVKEKKS